MILSGQAESLSPLCSHGRRPQRQEYLTVLETKVPLISRQWNSRSWYMYYHYWSKIRLLHSLQKSAQLDHSWGIVSPASILHLSKWFRILSYSGDTHNLLGMFLCRIRAGSGNDDSSRTSLHSCSGILGTRKGSGNESRLGASWMISVHPLILQPYGLDYAFIVKVGRGQDGRRLHSLVSRGR